MRTNKLTNLIVVLFTGIALTICTADSVPAQKKETKSTEATSKETKTTRKKSKVRVPPHYGKLNLSKEQRDKIYKIQANYKSQMDSLRKQLAELNSKRKAECKTVLTASQKSILDKILSDIASKKETSKKTVKK
ncbi:hypothetical protein [Gimesia aquarii]|uniref:LTXXQ motif protein n=1 Tax=Gimesia aquarii TaxID=2527964 RepID=A0A517VVL7_9PLAN|nr:hypothetical protein [Gimesia aquarii]QDT97046.1 hypothetical protein V144x_25170 [Gimesia aquarii]